MIVVEGPQRGARVERTLWRRLFFRRQFYLALLKIAVARRRRPRGDGHVFVSLMGGIGDLVNFFPTLERMAAANPVEMGTAGYPYLALVRSNPHVREVHTPFIYKPHRDAHRRFIERILSRFYERVLLLDFTSADWWREGKHLAQVYADRCGVPVPTRGVIYVPEEHRTLAARYLAERGLERFVYVVQMVRRRLPWKSWPLAHWRRLLELLHRDFGLPIIVDTVGSDERSVPPFCIDAGRVDILTAAAVIARARVFVGSDSGLSHVAAAVGAPTVSIQIGFPPEVCRPLGDQVVMVRQRRPFDEPAATVPEEVLEATRQALQVAS